MTIRRRVLLAGAAALAAAPARAQQTDYPDRAVRYIVPFTPAGLTDIMARLVAHRLAADWARPVVVENRPGGNALIGAEAAAKATADGYTLLAITLTHAVNVSLFPQAPYELLRDFAPISILGALPLVVVVNPANPARDLAELLAQARSRPLNGGSSGNGSPPHLALELFRREAEAGPKLVHVPYRGGAPGVTDLVAGNLDLMLSNLPECIGQIRAGRLRPLAVTAPERHRLLPEVPTVREAGAPGLEINNWTGVVTNAAVPQPILARLGSGVQAAIQDPSVRQKAEEGGFEVLGWEAARSRAFLTEEVARWGRLVQEAGIRAD
ncbi:MAG TPA: tripartite tricarboxylate transporter substrate binding protein [Crenalkalicoccus sp.]|jgi:tripartite-type tricarboxylate transporter receptor subunit TctC|nr:tripartite tricarboxylate transporter substrate binding protein [Crenalkalicoccus sp.]